MRMVIFKTDAHTLPGVLKHSKHAFQRKPNLARGEVILLAQTIQSLPRGEKQIRYRMTFLRSYVDRDGESDRIWGHHWHYIIEGSNLKELRHPFNIRDVQITTTNYAQGGPFVYLDAPDEKALQEGGYLEPVDTTDPNQPV